MYRWDCRDDNQLYFRQNNEELLITLMKKRVLMKDLGSAADGADGGIALQQICERIKGRSSAVTRVQNSLSMRRQAAGV